MPDDAERFDIPADDGRRVALVATHLNGRAGTSNVLVWFTEWGVWPSSERRHIVDRFRASYGEHRRLIDSPGHRLSAQERDERLSLVTLGVLFLWDLDVLPDDASFALHYSHDEWGWLAQRAAV